MLAFASSPHQHLFSSPHSESFSVSDLVPIPIRFLPRHCLRSPSLSVFLQMSSGPSFAPPTFSSLFCVSTFSFFSDPSPNSYVEDAPSTDSSPSFPPSTLPGYISLFYKREPLFKKGNGCGFPGFLETPISPLVDPLSSSVIPRGRFNAYPFQR